MDFGKLNKQEAEKIIQSSLSVRKVNEEVWYSQQLHIQLNQVVLECLKVIARQNERNRVRICTHISPENTLHEMIMVYFKGAHLKPHKQYNKTISYTILEGEVDLVFFDEIGKEIKIIEMGEMSSKKKYFIRTSTSQFRAMRPKSEFLVFHEITNGPFVTNDTIYATW